jgi:hypothetical protein
LVRDGRGLGIDLADQPGGGRSLVSMTGKVIR